MKINHIFSIPLVAALTGCAGYNHTMFMTKSNVGLDFDAKPPTAEINISRKEAVIAPGFENGQTPPVMASFKPHAGFGSGFQNFFVGVDQTFAGGDSAVAMATLYSQASIGTDIKKYDSTLKLTQPPKYHDVFRRMATPGTVRPFIFGTDTMLGLKVAWSGAGGQFPDTVKLGFNRKEFAWAPLSMSVNTNDTNAPYYIRMPSFLATIQSKIETYAGTNSATTNTSGISALQYFATGNAATLLALQPGVRQAMAERMDPVAARLTKELKEKAVDSKKADCIRAWLDSNSNNRKLLTNWMQTNNIEGHPSFWLDSGKEDEFDKAINTFNIPCQ